MKRGDPRLRHFDDKLNRLGGALLARLSCMRWAPGSTTEPRRQALHEVLRAAPGCLWRTYCHRRILRESVKKGEVIVVDRYHGLEYGGFGGLRDLGRVLRDPYLQRGAHENGRVSHTNRVGRCSERHLAECDEARC